MLEKRQVELEQLKTSVTEKTEVIQAKEKEITESKVRKKEE
jgi:hypothetical protein